MREAIKHYSKYCCMQDPPKFEEKLDIYIVSKCIFHKKSINYKGTNSNLAVERLISHHLTQVVSVNITNNEIQGQHVHLR